MNSKQKIVSESEQVEFPVRGGGASDSAAAASGFASATGCLGALAPREPGAVTSVVASAKAIRRDVLPRRYVRMFKPQFAPLVENGVKCQTVRPTPKNIPKRGDIISLREWTGKPYRSKQRILREATITEVQSIWFNGFTILVGEPGTEWPLLSREVPEAFARADGFESLASMTDWFATNHGLPFTGIVIKWQNISPALARSGQRAGRGNDQALRPDRK